MAVKNFKRSRKTKNRRKALLISVLESKISYLNIKGLLTNKFLTMFYSIQRIKLISCNPGTFLCDKSQKIKEIKNIKRRVYDALNVLVAVGILGKHQRCVCITEWTNVPGKRHATEWAKVNNKIDHLNKLKKNCADKS